MKITSIQECDEAMKTALKLKTDLQKEITKSVNIKVDKLNTMLNEIDKEIKAYGETNKAVIFSEDRTVKLAHGTLKLTESQSIEIEDEGETLKKLKRMKEDDAINTSYKVNKTALKRFDDKRLTMAGAIRKTVDRFSYKLKTAA